MIIALPFLLAAPATVADAPRRGPRATITVSARIVEAERINMGKQERSANTQPQTHRQDRQRSKRGQQVIVEFY